MNYESFIACLSEARMRRYLLATGEIPEKAIQLYQDNLRISKAFHPLLSVFEVVLRNRIDHVLSNYFDDANWIMNQKSGFMADASLTFFDKRTGKLVLNQYLRKEVEKAEQRLERSDAKITSGRIIAEQSLGFWTAMFELSHYRALKGRPIQIFQDLPSGFGRKQINEALETVRIFRNRINHNEPICFVGNRVDFTRAILAQKIIYDLFEWMEIDVHILLGNLDDIAESIKVAQKD